MMDYLGRNEEILPFDMFLFQRGCKGAPDLFLVEVAPGWTQAMQREGNRKGNKNKK